MKTNKRPNYLDILLLFSFQMNCNIMEETLFYYQKAIPCGGSEKMAGIENCFIAMAREIAFECMIYL